MSGTWRETGTDSVTIATGTAITTSSIAIKKDFGKVGLIFPAMTTGSVGFDVSADGSTYARLNGSTAAEPKLAVGTGGNAFLISDLEPFDYFRLVTATQAAARTIQINYKS